MFFRPVLQLLAHPHLILLSQGVEETALLGGQAVMEGVMMRSPSSYCVAVRLADGSIRTDQSAIESISDGPRWYRWPVVRGLVTLGSAMALGMKALRFSAECLTGKQEQSSRFSGALQLIVSLSFTIALYKFVPLYAATALGRHVNALNSRLAINLVDGLLRIAIFAGFMFLLSRVKEMHRLFEYHGAEHRVVHNYESGLPVTVQNAQRFSTLHPRCGTSFLVTVLLISLVAYAFLPLDGFWARFAARLLLLPLVVGLSYESIRYAARHRSGMLAWFTTPGLWLQRITTQPPAADQTEVAIRALDGALELERKQGGVLVIA